MSALPFLTARTGMIALARRMNASGLNQGTSGNLSQRVEGGFLITPSGMEYEALVPEDVVFMRLDGTSEGKREPSSEWRIHRDVFASRPEVGGVLHTHSPCSTALACLRRPIPAFHYMVTRAGGDTIRCADYATFGSEALSRHVLTALEGRRACLMANHGMLAVGDSLPSAFRLAVEVETLADMYLRALQVGEPVLLDAEEMARVLDKWKTYGQPPPRPPPG